MSEFIRNTNKAYEESLRLLKEKYERDVDELIKAQNENVDSEADRIAKLPYSRVTVEEQEFYKHAGAFKFVPRQPETNSITSNRLY